MVALPELLQEAGYHTLISGKWHLGLKPENNPAARGFDRSLALLPGCSNHYAYEPQFGPDYHAFFERIPPLYTRDGAKVEFEPNANHSGFYSTDVYADNMIDYLEERPKDKPFFAYLPFSAPHWPLQCSPEDRDAYKGVYDQGPDVLREQRLANLRRLGIVGNVTPSPVIASEVSEWSHMSDDERLLSARSMEVYSGMVTA